MKNCHHCGFPLSEAETEPAPKFDLHWSRETETGKPSAAYGQLVDAVTRIIKQNGQVLINGGASVCAERIVYELVDILGMMPNDAARKYVERLLKENGMNGHVSEEISDMRAASAG